MSNMPLEKNSKNSENSKNPYLTIGLTCYYKKIQNMYPQKSVTENLTIKVLITNSKHLYKKGNRTFNNKINYKWVIMNT